MAIPWTAAVPWTAVFWLGFLTACATLIRMAFDGTGMAAIGLVGVTTMFVGSKIGRDFLGIA